MLNSSEHEFYFTCTNRYKGNDQEMAQSEARKKTKLTIRKMQLATIVVILSELMLNVPVNSNGHVGTLPPFDLIFTQH